MKLIKRLIPVAISIAISVVSTMALASEKKEATFESEELKKIFEKVIFISPGEVKVRKGQMIQAKSDLEVHFNNVKQIQETLGKNIHLSSMKSIYYVMDGVENNPITYLSDKQPLNFADCIFVEGPNNLQLSGELILDKTLVLPQGCDFEKLSVKDKVPESFGQDDVRKQLIKILENFDEKLFQIRTQDANKLTELVKVRDSKSDAEKLKITNLCPQLLMISPKGVEIIVTDVIDSQVPFALISRTMEELKSAATKYRLGSNNFPLILPKASGPGIYSLHSLYPVDTHMVICEDDMLLTGSIILPKSYFSIKSKKNIWCVNLKISSNSNIEIEADGLVGYHDLSVKTLQELGPKIPLAIYNTYLQVLVNTKALKLEDAQSLLQLAQMSQIKINM